MIGCLEADRDVGHSVRGEAELLQRVLQLGRVDTLDTCIWLHGEASIRSTSQYGYSLHCIWLHRDASIRSTPQYSYVTVSIVRGLYGTSPRRQVYGGTYSSGPPG